MTVSTHLDQLREKHEALKIRIKDEERRPGVDHIHIKTLKRQKLHLKEEIQKLSETRH